MGIKPWSERDPPPQLNTHRLENRGSENDVYGSPQQEQIQDGGEVAESFS